MSGPTVWLAVHDLSRSGVPVLLERYLDAAPDAVRRKVHVVAFHDGPLRASLAGIVASLHVFEPEVGRSRVGTLAVGARQLGVPRVAELTEHLRWLRRRRAVPAPDVLVVHGAGAWAAVDAVGPDVPVVLHLHELEAAFERCVPRSARRSVPGRVDAVMTVSRPVADLAEQLGFTASTIVEVPGVVGPAATSPVRTPELAGAGTWVMGAGRPGWRKGTDRLASLAHELARRRLDTTVGWVGGRPLGHEAQWVESVDPVRWFPECDDPWSLLAGARVVVVPSREDPLPLVALEAGQHGLPVVAMPTGGLVDLLGHGRGLVAEREDLWSLCDGVERMVTEADFAASCGAALQDHVHRHHRAEVVVPQWISVIEAAAERGRRTRHAASRRWSR